MPSLTPHAGKDSQRADLRLPGITRFTPHPVRATGEDMGNRLGSQRWGDPEATIINVEPAKDCKSLPARPGGYRFNVYFDEKEMSEKRKKKI